MPDPFPRNRNILAGLHRLGISPKERSFSDLELQTFFAKHLKQASPHADPIVVSLALVLSRRDAKNPCTVVTEEKLRGDGSHKVPNVCKQFGLKTGTSSPL